jgi:hypothetical protein
MQILFALVALPAVALLLLVASRLEDGLRAATVPARPAEDLGALSLQGAEAERSPAPVG